MAIILEFGLKGNYYAMDINLTREIVEALPLTPIPRTPGYIAGMTNIRGEITTIVAIDELIGAGGRDTGADSEKFIIFVPDAARGENIGMMVDEVFSVLEVQEKQIERSENGGTTGRKSFIKGIIRISNAPDGVEGASVSQRLVLYLDIEKLITHLFELASR
ncbi:MAG: purine-binding chemotaxis protein [Methanoregulaceae archaeon PtaU1.Bin059]|nr:MAG: purine-binding chemotaxis protein [Methanoregulaceae archaeon PtaB.Bin152]OPY39544.1 MAG: purine-binding chemotaxis protein [Methanoregulaceae archaeon PtaU1.Bin059]